ncbi:hypothetical protein [Sandaracinobacter neustonicus]
MNRVVLSCAAALMCGAPAYSAVVMDQSAVVEASPSFAFGWSNTFLQPSFAVGRLGQMQSITAGKSGLLTRLDLQIANSGHNLSLPFSISLVSGEPGVAGLIDVVGALDFRLGDTPFITDVESGSFFSVDVSSFGYKVVPGQKFSILLMLPNFDLGPTSPTVTGPRWAYGLTPEDGSYYPEGFLVYEGGFNTLIDSNGNRSISGSDRGFRTYVDVSGVPDVSSWALMIMGFGLVGFNVRRRGVAVAA